MEAQAASSLNCVGQEACVVFTPFSIRETDNPENVIEHFDKYFIPQTDVVVKRHKLENRSQRATEVTKAIVANLRNIDRNCYHGNLGDELKVNGITCGVKDVQLKNRLLREPNLQLKKEVEILLHD